MAELPEVPLTIKPRRVGFVHLPIVAVDARRGNVLYETTGEIGTLDDLIEILPRVKSEAIVATNNAADLVEILDDRIGSVDPRFQWRATIVEREIVSLTGLEPMVTEEEVFGYFGFRRPNGHEKGRWFHLLDPVTFFSRDLALKSLLRWAIDVRSFCADNDLPIRPTAAGLAGLLLRDRRFFPNDRRKIPQATNEKARPHLPGNHYRATAIRGFPYKAFYIDQQSAHHAAARDLVFPCSKDLMARGYFDTEDDKVWVAPSDPEYPSVVSSIGLFKGRVTVSARRRGQYPHPIAELGIGSHVVHFYSNEIPSLRRSGIEIEYLIAAWTSNDADPGLSLYATWAMQQLAAADKSRSQWLKTTLLSAYGLLAARPRKLKTAYRQGSGPEIHVGKMIGRLREASKATTIPIANVIARGMIEAEVRQRSLDLAADLVAAGNEVLAIYADGILFTGTPTLIPNGWEIEGRSDRLYVIDDVSIIATDTSEIVKLPGRSGEIRKKLLDHYRDKAENDS